MTVKSPRYKTIRLVTLVGALVNLILALVKMVVGYIGFSHALFIDGIHSLSDLLSDALVIYGAKQGEKHADEDHPYGHARVETFFAVLFGFILISVGIGIIIDAIGRLSQQGVIEIPSSLALVVALISVISKEVLFQYTLHYSKKLESTLLKANAWHHRSDAISSIVVLVGVAGSIYGIAYLDIVAAVIVAMMIAKIGWDILYEGINELVDKGLDKQEVENISKIIETIPGVIQVHLLRTRQMGGKALVDVHVQVPYAITVSEGHRISDEVSKRLTQEIDIVSEVLVHIDPEDDENFSSCSHLPLRDEVLKQLINYIQDDIISTEFFKNSSPESLTIRQSILSNLIKSLNENSSNDLKILYYNGQIKLIIFFPFSKLNIATDILLLESICQKNIDQFSFNQADAKTEKAAAQILQEIKFGFM